MSEKIYGQFDLETIEKLADIVKNKDLGEITIADGDKVITVKGKKCPPPAPIGMPMPMAVAQLHLQHRQHQKRRQHQHR